ncbi:hypothetical protein JKP88DRAFT_249104 [Tribonema minus]|uniref:Uncharacterized protein n=1 Tax=Tribonema minus TaxID=303371 RepID=A0A835YV00_9STRA|nr:hypothetical protein JKP88DRAFT_249104 [Tribonema minus]
MIGRKVFLATAACLLGAAWYAPRRARRRTKRKPKTQLETKNSSREEAWALSAPVDAEWIQLVLQRLAIHGRMAESYMTEAYTLSHDDDGEHMYDYEAPQAVEGRAATVLASGEHIMAEAQDMFIYLSHFLRTKPITLPPEEVEAIRESMASHLRIADDWRSAYRHLVEFFPDSTCTPRNDSKAKRRRELLQGLLDALDTEVEVLEGCKREVRELPADAPNRDSTIIEVVNLVHHLHFRACDLQCCLGGYMADRSRETVVGLTRQCERLYRLGRGLQRVPMAQGKKDEIQRRLSAHRASNVDSHWFIREHLPLLVQHNAAPWQSWYPPPPPAPRVLSPEQIEALRARIQQLRLRRDIANAPDVCAKFSSRPRRVLHRRVDPVPPRGARTRVSAPATAAAAAESAAGPLLPDGERVAHGQSRRRHHPLPPHRQALINCAALCTRVREMRCVRQRSCGSSGGNGSSGSGTAQPTPRPAVRPGHWQQQQQRQQRQQRQQHHMQSRSSQQQRRRQRQHYTQSCWQNRNIHTGSQSSGPLCLAAT